MVVMILWAYGCHVYAVPFLPLVEFEPYSSTSIPVSTELILTVTLLIKQHLCSFHLVSPVAVLGNKFWGGHTKKL